MMSPYFNLSEFGSMFSASVGCSYNIYCSFFIKYRAMTQLQARKYNGLFLQLCLLSSKMSLLSLLLLQSTYASIRENENMSEKGISKCKSSCLDDLFICYGECQRGQLFLDAVTNSIVLYIFVIKYVFLWSVLKKFFSAHVLCIIPETISPVCQYNKPGDFFPAVVYIYRQH